MNQFSLCLSADYLGLDENSFLHSSMILNLLSIVYNTVYKRTGGFMRLNAGGKEWGRGTG